MKLNVWKIGLVILATACGSKDVAGYVPPPPPPPPPVSGVHIAIVDYAYRSDTVTASIGELISWTNTASQFHTATSDSAVFDSGVIQPGASYTVSFAKAGTYTYHDNLFPTMTATITVSP
jgi:plastocyanin